MRSNIVELAIEAKQTTQGIVRIVGSWIWIEFPVKPCLEVRDWLKQNGFHWNYPRRVWQFAGTPSKKSPADSWYILEKYGVKIIEED